MFGSWKQANYDLYQGAFMVAHPSSPVYIQEAALVVTMVGGGCWFTQLEVTHYTKHFYFGGWKQADYDLYQGAFMVAHPSNPVYIQEAAPAARISSSRHADNTANRECSFHSADLHFKYVLVMSPIDIKPHF